MTKLYCPTCNDSFNQPFIEVTTLDSVLDYRGETKIIYYCYECEKCYVDYQCTVKEKND